MALKNYKNGNLHGISEYFYKNGNTQSLFTYVDGKLNGISKQFYLNGIEKEIYYYKDDKKNGEAKIYFENGKLARKENYKNDSLHGDFKSFHENGKIKIQGFYHLGKFDSVWTYYDTYGREVGKGDFKNGSGIQKAFYYNHQLKREIHYKNNLKHGPDIKYNKEGDTIEVFIYENDSFVRKEEVKQSPTIP